MRKLAIWISLLIGVSLFFVVLGHISWNEAMLILTHARLDYLAVYICASILVRLFLSWRWHVILKAKQMAVPFWRNVSYRMAGFAVSFVTPGPRVGGELITASLATRHNSDGNAKFSRTLSTLAIDRAVELQTFATMFFIGVFTLSVLGDIPDGLKVLLVSASSLLLIVMVLLAVNIINSRPFLTKLAVRMSSSRSFKREVKHFEETLVTFYREDRKDFLKSHLIAAVAWLISIIEYKYLLLLLGFDVPLYGVFIVYSFVGFAYIMPVPLALGTLEGGQAAAFKLIGLSAAGGFILALVTRLRDILLTIIGFMILLYYGITPATIQKPVRR